ACLDCALELSREVLGNETNPPPPLGPALTAVKRRLAQVRLEGATGLRSRLRAELSRAAEVGDSVALRAALAEADRQQHAALLEAPQLPPWSALERGRRHLAQLVAL
ncbi:unnamed protein product, partial [Polarella glacialis]